MASAQSKGTETAALTAYSAKHFLIQAEACNASSEEECGANHDAAAPTRATQRKAPERSNPQQVWTSDLARAECRAARRVTLSELEPDMLACMIFAESASVAP